MKKFKDGSRVMTAREAKKQFPNPRFFYRASKDMAKANIEAVVLRNIKEVRYWLDQWEKLARGQHAGRMTKQHLAMIANELHDFRVGMDISGGEFGRPYLWEV